jgi:hypothetical protein
MLKKGLSIAISAAFLCASCEKSDSLWVDGTWSPKSIGCSKSKSVKISNGIAQLKSPDGKTQEFFRIREIYPENNGGKFSAEIIYSMPDNLTVAIFNYTADQIQLYELFVDETKVYPNTENTTDEDQTFVNDYLNFERCS